MKLINALRYSKPSNLVFVGAGGKTTAIFRAARELLLSNDNYQAAKSVLVTTTTHFGSWQSAYADHIYKINSVSDFQTLEKDIPIGVILLFGVERNNFLGSLPVLILEKVLALAEERNMPLLIEADGSHTYPLKAPIEHEPAIPDFAKNVVVVAGLSGLGKPLSKKWVHRPEKFSELSNLKMGEIVTGKAIAKVLLHKDGGLKKIPPNARRMVILNQADTPELKSSAKTISGMLIAEYRSSIIASLSQKGIALPSNGGLFHEQTSGIHAVIEPIGGIILAAGESSRFGEPKQLILWKDEPLIRHVIMTALKAGLSPVCVVLGSSAAEIESVIKDLPVRIVNNNEWATGVSSTIKVGLTSVQKEVGGVVFLQADQPHIPTSLINRLVEAHEATLSPVIGPQIDGQRGSPVLFDASTFAGLLSLEGDIGGRALFAKYRVQWIPWHDSNLLLDIDSPEDYSKFLQIYSDDKL